MMPPLAVDLPYRPDSAALFEALVDLAWPVFFDSGWPGCLAGRYDILSAEPIATLVTRGARTEIETRRGAGRGLCVSAVDPLAVLAEALGPLRPGVAGLPFSGGAIGYFGYDLARRLDRLPGPVRAAEAGGEAELPEMALGLYDWAVVVDHRERRTRLVAAEPAGLARWRDRLARPPAVERAGPSAPFRVLGPIRSNLTRDAYLAAIARIQQYLRDGDCYQVNLAQRFAAPAEGDAWPAYRRLRALSPAPFSAYLDHPHGRILCASPERFLHLRDGVVTTRPIKGTRPRGVDPATDRRLARTLRESPKDRAENLMIVDLLRNDLGKVCALGSVEVPELFAVERFAQVHHLVSTVCGRLAPGRTALDLLRAAFPGGSITGAPKRRAMEVIEELEPHRREVYCGAIGYLGFDGAMDTNVAIRTLVHSGRIARLWAGGGIVADSVAALEYQETLDKAGALLTILGELRAR
jgi:para-aminobenzoate synthetase component 1